MCMVHIRAVDVLRCGHGGNLNQLGVTVFAFLLLYIVLQAHLHNSQTHLRNYYRRIFTVIIDAIARLTSVDALAHGKRICVIVVDAFAF
jgi:hypothetical protein